MSDRRVAVVAGTPGAEAQHKRYDGFKKSRAKYAICRPVEKSRGKTGLGERYSLWRRKLGRPGPTGGRTIVSPNRRRSTSASHPLKISSTGPRRENAWQEQFLFRSFVLADSIVSMIDGRGNDSVDDSCAASSWHRAVRVDVSDARSSHRARQKRSLRFASFMIHPTSRFFLSSWRRRRACAVAVSQ